MIPILSLITSVKDYLEVVHKFIEIDSVNLNYTELGSILTFFLISMKTFLIDIFSFSWLLKENLWSLPIIIPDISSAMVSEISVLDGYFHNAFNFLDAPISNSIPLSNSISSVSDWFSSNQENLTKPYQMDSNLAGVNQPNGFISCLEKLTIGLINSFFLFLPTSTAHIITLRRFVMQGLDAGYISGLGTIAGNILWLGSVILGCRFFVIPWLSLDIFRYVLGFILLVKYMWDSYNERKTVLEDVSKKKIFLLNFLLALTEQTSIYPFMSNLSISPETSLLETFTAVGTSFNNGGNGTLYILIHFSYLLGITLGSLSLLHLSCWFWENPAFKLYMWVISSFKVSTSFYYKVLNFTFLYLTMLSAVCSIPYYGLDYTITNPLGYVSDDRLIQDKVVLETSFLGTKASDRNTRRNRGRHGRRERWKRRIRKYRTFDASLYDQGVYDLFTIEDLNYGFDRFWLRRKLRNHRVRFRFFPGPWMRSFKKQLAKPRLESYTGPRIEFFRILFEQVYHPSFHAYNKNPEINSNSNSNPVINLGANSNQFNTLGSTYIRSYTKKNQNPLLNSRIENQTKTSLGSSIIKRTDNNTKDSLLVKSTLRKFLRKFNTRLKTSQVIKLQNSVLFASTQRVRKTKENLSQTNSFQNRMVKSTGFKSVAQESKNFNSTLNNFNLNALILNNTKKKISTLDSLDEKQLLFNSINISPISENIINIENLMKNSKKTLTKKDLQILNYRSLLTQNNLVDNSSTKINQSLMLLHPLKFYLQKEAAFKRKLRYYSPSIYRKFAVENNAPYFRVMMKRYFYNYKPTLRWERTMKVASLRKARRKTTRIPRKLQNIDAALLPLRGSEMNSLENKENLNTNANLKTGLSREPKEIVLPLEKAALQKSTYNYSVVSKRASRYRYQIYKDVLQHWYYSPFNRLLLKLDVDSFIRRQPNAHFLTAKEEKLLHLRRFLLTEHYNTLRWYTNMEHYRSMKTQLKGGTKSFSSRFYNQQFSGTFKKVRHLFAITPNMSSFSMFSSLLSNSSATNNNTSPLAFGFNKGNTENQKEKTNDQIKLNNNITKDLLQNQNEANVLKFDQPLYNEYTNTSKNPLLNSLIIHEELLEDFNNPNMDQRSVTNNDILTESQNIVRQYLIQARSTREAYIKKLLSENNYSELTQFIYKGQKIRGNAPTTNQRLLNNQEKEYLLSSDEKAQLDSTNSFNKSLNNNLDKKVTDSSMENLYLTYLKNWKRRVNDQESLKNYLNRRTEKREKRKQKKEKQIMNKLKRLETWFSGNNTVSNISNTNPIKQGKAEDDLLTSGLQKSIFDGMVVLNKLDNQVVSSLISEPQIGNSSREKANKSIIRLQDLNLRFKDLKTLEKVKLTKNIKTSVEITRKFISNNSALYDNKKRKNLNTLLTIKSISSQLQQKVQSVANICFYSVKKAKNTYLDFTKITNLLKPIKRKSLTDWKNKERVLGKQKRSRKEFKLLNKKSLQNTNQLITQLNLPISNSQTTADELELALQTPSRKKRVEETQKTTEETPILSDSFKRKRSPQRRSRIRRSRGVFKKRSLNDSLRNDFSNFLNEKNTNLKDSSFDQFYQKFSLSSKDTEEQPLKQRKSKQRKERFWKQKRSKYVQKRRKYRKRRRYTIIKIRNLNKQFKRIKNQIEIQNWWWKQIVPSIQASNEALWQIEKDKLIQQKLSQLSISEILERDTLNNFQNNSLQIGNKDFKPLALPDSLRIITNANPNLLNQSSLNEKTLLISKEGNLISDLKNNNTILDNLQSEKLNSLNLDSKQSLDNKDFSLINKLYESLFLNSSQFAQSSDLFYGEQDILSNQGRNTPFLLPNTSLPFYAGWDESLRKLIVTNRLLSRKEAGFTLNNTNSTTNRLILDGFEESGDKYASNLAVQDIVSSSSQVSQNFEKQQFSLVPLQGMNAATTLYWQIPFTTYDPDQFFALGMDGFSPIGWRKFLFRHSILKNWLDSKQNLKSNKRDNSFVQSQDLAKEVNPKSTQLLPLVVKTRTNVLNDLSNFVLNTSSYNIKSSGDLDYLLSKNKQNTQQKKAFAISRRLKKRYRRVKKHPRTPVWFPSGPLLNQVLPVHYIYVFYKRSRLPRDRYLKRRLLNVKNLNTNFQSEASSFAINLDFTLRKRIKPKRKYHLKRDYYASNVVIPRRLKFMTISNSDSNIKKWRILSPLKIHKPIAEIVKEQQLLRRSTLQKQRSSKQQPNMRVKQLRRRVQRQILRSVWRYQPRAGGFVWPGDYLKLELVKAPKLQNLADSSTQSLNNGLNNGLNIGLSGEQNAQLNEKTKRSKRKKKRTLVEWQIQPKKYLYQKHNIKVLKKKLQKSQRSFDPKASNLSFSKNNAFNLNVLRNLV